MKKFSGFVCLFIWGWGILNSQTQCLVATPAWSNRTEETGRGYYFDIIRSIYEPLGIRVNIQIVPWNRAMEMVSHSDADMMLGLFYNPVSPEAPRFVKWPFDLEETGVLYKKTSVPRWNGEKSLENQKVLWPRGYNYYKFLSVETDWSEVTDLEAGLGMLALDRTTFLMFGKNGYLALPPGTVDPAIYDFQVVISNPLYPSFAPGENSQKLARIYDERMAILTKDGTIKRIYESYGKASPELKSRL